MQAYAAHTPSKTFKTSSGLFINEIGTPVAYVDQKHIAGSNAEGIAVGFSVVPWCYSRIGIDLNYDNVRYEKNYSIDEDAKGFGGTLYFKQALFDTVSFSLLAANRRPFNNFQGSLDWIIFLFNGKWKAAFEAGYTSGKHTLPNTWDIGLSAHYFLDQRCETCKPEGSKEEFLIPATDDFIDYTSDPAVYLPQVLAIPDQRLVTTELVAE